jgi:hypothetical protein
VTVVVVALFKKSAPLDVVRKQIRMAALLW